MDFQEAMQELESLGTAQNVKVYRRHGSGENVFGVSFANLEKLRKRIKMDDELGNQLWATGNSDAMTLAAMIFDPERLRPAIADARLKSIQYHVVADYFARCVARSPIAHTRLEKWTKARGEYVRQCGYSLLSAMLVDNPEALDDDDALRHLERIENTIHQSPNRARYAMNMALASIGIYKENVRQQAIETAERIGTVEVDHGETGCKTPEAAEYIRKAVTKNKQRNAKKKVARRSKKS